MSGESRGWGVWRKKLFAANSSVLCSDVVLVSPDLRIFLISEALSMRFALVFVVFWWHHL